MELMRILFGGAVEKAAFPLDGNGGTLLAPHLARPCGALLVCSDGAVRSSRGGSGLAAVAWDRPGSICAIWLKRGETLTSNEAEYAAAALALEGLLPYCPAQVTLCSDSLVLVEQVNGRAAVRAPALRAALTDLRALAARLGRVHFVHIPREHNSLADALANHAFGDDRRFPAGAAHEAFY